MPPISFEAIPITFTLSSVFPKSSLFLPNFLFSLGVLVSIFSDARKAHSLDASGPYYHSHFVDS